MTILNVTFPLADDNIAAAEAQYNAICIQFSIDTDKLTKRFSKLGFRAAQSRAIKFYAVQPELVWAATDVRALAVLCLNVSYGDNVDYLAEAICRYYGDFGPVGDSRGPQASDAYEPSTREMAEYYANRAEHEARQIAEMEAASDAMTAQMEAEAAEEPYRDPVTGLTGNNDLDYDLTTVDGILHALKNGCYLGGPASTSAQRKNLRSKLRRLGYRLSEHKAPEEADAENIRQDFATDTDADEEAYQARKAAAEYATDR